MARPHRSSVSLAVAVVGVVVSLSVLAWWPPLTLDAGTIAFALWQGLPFVLILGLRSLWGFSDLGMAVAAAASAILTVYGEIEMYYDTSSTAVLGFVFFPISFAGVAFVIWIIDAVVRL